MGVLRQQIIDNNALLRRVTRMKRHLDEVSEELSALASAKFVRGVLEENRI